MQDIRDIKVLLKGNYVYPQRNDCVSLRQFVFASVDGKRRLLLNFRNDRNEVLSRLKFIITFIDDAGRETGAATYDSGSISVEAQQSFPFEKPVVAPKGCTDFRVKVTAAYFGDFVYGENAGQTGVAFVKAKPAKKPSKKVAQQENKSETRKFISPVRIGLIALLTLMLAAIASFVHLSAYKSAPEDGFILNGVRYAFASSDKTEGASVYVYGSYGNVKTVTISDEIEGYRVVGIREGAFRNNQTIEELVIDGGFDVYTYTFYGCGNLKRLVVKDSSVIETSAFGSCGSLESVTLVNVKAIGEDAFANCERLQTVEISADDPEATVTVYGGAFAGCKKIKSVSISETAVFMSGEAAFSGATDIEELMLKNYAYGGEGLAQQTTITDLFTQGYYMSVYNGLPSLKTLEIDDVKSVGDLFCYNMPKLTSVKIGKISDGEIGNHAFENCPLLSDLSLGTSPVSIGERAFADTAIKEIPTGKLTYIGKEAFYDCSSLRSVSIPVAVGRLYENTFYGCSSLERVSFNENTPITELADGLFSGCSSLKTINVPKGITAIGKETFKGCKSVESLGELKNVTSFGEGAFDGCKSLKSINIAAELTAIPTRLFADCEKLDRIDIPSTVTEIGDEAFSGCKSISEFSLPDGLTILGEGVFSGCSDLIGVDLPDGVNVIPSRAFENCVSLTSFTVGENISKVGSEAFKGCGGLTRFSAGGSVSLGYAALEGCSSLIELNIPDLGENGGATYIGYIFGGDSDTENAEKVPSSLEKVTLTNTYDLAEGAFGGCGSIKEVVLESGLYGISDYAFGDCVSLEVVTLPDTLRSLGNYAFIGCVSLLEVFNYSDLAITAQSGVDGMVGFHAVAVYDSPSVERIRKFSDGDFDFVFVPTSGSYFLTGGGANAQYLELPNVIYDRDASYYSYEYAVANEAFKGNDKITEAFIPFAVTTLGISAFEACGSLTTADASSASVTEIRDFTFYCCGALRQVALPYSVNRISRYAFYNCGSLESIYLYSVKTIGAHAFDGCAALGQVELSSELTEISDNAFAGCRSLERITLPRSLSYIGSNAFDGAKGLREVVNLSYLTLTIGSDGNGCVAKYAIVIRSSAYDSALTTYLTSDGFVFKYDQSGMATYLVDYTGDAAEITLGTMNAYGRTVTNYKIACYAFSDNEKLAKVTIGSGVTEIGAYAFENCSSLKTVEALDSGITKIAAHVFDNCGLGFLSLPATLNSVDYSFISGNYAYTEVYYGGSRSAADSYGLGYASIYGTLYTYVDCIHDYGNYWMYDRSGRITTFNPYEVVYKTAVQPTCNSSGTETGICGHCGRTFTRSIPALGHEYTEKVIRQATCQQEGLIVYSCVRGDDSYTINVPKTDHIVGSNGVCTTCGKKFVYVDSSNFNSLKNVINDYSYPFECSGSTISSTNVRGSTSSTLIITADKAMTVRFNYRLSSYYGQAIVSVNGYEYETNTSTRSKSFEVDLKAGDNLRITYYNSSGSTYAYYYLYVEDLVLIY